ncbi:hypothetical protein D3C74_82380 [compost metagenome]
MLSQALIEYCKGKGWWYEDTTTEYEEGLAKLGIQLDSDVGQFYLHVEDAPTFLSRKRELYHIAWFMVYSDYMRSVTSIHAGLKMPEEYIPLDSFEGEYGYFYNRATDEVLCLGLGQEWQDFQNGRLQPQWKSFNAFMEWYFDIGAEGQTSD